MAGVRIEADPPIRSGGGLLAINFGAFRDSLTASALRQVQSAINAVERILREYRVGDVTKLQILNTDGRQIGWIGANPPDYGIQSDTILAGQLKANENASHIGLGRVLAPAQISAGATNLLTVGTDEQVQRFDFAAGGGAYTYNIDFDLTGAYEGSAFWINVQKAASLNPSIVFRNGSGGGTILTINTALAENYACIFIYNGTAWERFLCEANSL